MSHKQTRSPSRSMILTFAFTSGRITAYRLWLITLLLAVTNPLVSSGEDGFAYSKAVDEAVHAEMKKQQIVGAAIGVIQNAKIVYTQGYGWADLDSHTPVTDETIFNWASNSKPLIAIAALQLTQRNQLDIDKPIVTYCPHLPEQMQQITTRQLLCHQSGIPHYSNGQIIPTGKTSDSAGKNNRLEELNPVKSLDRFIMSPLIYEPGSQISYSSYAYVLLTAVVQSAGQSPIASQLENRIIQPLAMNSFQLDLPTDSQAKWTLAYNVENGKPRQVPDYAHFWKHGAGGYKSNIKDFAKFANALASSQLIEQSMSDRMWTRQHTSKGKETSYGLGVVVSNSGSTLKISHGGSQDETRTRMVIYPRRKHGIVVMCNTQGCDPAGISTAIYSSLAKAITEQAD